MNGAEDIFPLTLTPATRSVASSGGGSPPSNTSRSVLSGGRLMMSGGMDAEVQYFDNSKLRAAVDELSELVQVVQQERDDLLRQLSEKEDTILTLRCSDIPKLDLSHVRQQLSSLKTELSNTKHEAQALSAQNTSLVSELRKQTQTVVAKDTLLKARARSISSYQQQIGELQSQLRILDESARSERNTNATHDILADGHLLKIRQQADQIHNLQRELDESTARGKQQTDLINTLQSDLTSANDRLHHFTASSVEQQLFNGFDSAIEMSEKNQRELTISLREANGTISMLRAELASVKNMTAEGTELEKSEERCRAVIQVAKHSKLKQLYAEAMSERKDIAVEECDDKLQLYNDMKDGLILVVLSDLKTTFEKSKKAFHNRILSELKPICDEAYQRGHDTAVKKLKSQKHPPPSTTTTSSNIYSTNSSVDFSTASLDEQLNLFELVLKKASASQVARCLSRCGLKVATMTPNTTLNSED
eukprot:TRINITY_DN22783_c0_g1_i1.p1 TRINITY_DN22783_c0_g1~~TRINITY_DN22783_c0_g1_i1.p1  ORF type:complete len:478 (+),score=133.24 TRINITY_DN22783_c0_g1_i1:113-1546(+)